MAKAEQAVNQEVVRRLAAVADDPLHWPSTARAAVTKLERDATELRATLATAKAAKQAAIDDCEALQAQQVLVTRSLCGLPPQYMQYTVECSTQ